MKISIVMPVFLGAYQNAATDRERKFERAVQSFLNQSYPNKSLIIVSDGCEITNRIVRSKFNHESIKLISIDKQPLFSGAVRQAGLNASDGDFITYLDADDIYKENNHLQVIVNGFNSNDCDWLYFNDYVKYFHLDHLPLAERNVTLNKGEIGTSNIAHKNKKDINWIGCDNYGHDHTFIMNMKNKYPNFKKISGTSYVVCHIPNSVDV